MISLTDIKLLLGITGDEQDPRLKVIISNTEDRLLAKLDGEELIPEELEYIVTEVAVARFNRIGSEGTTGHSVEGERMDFLADDFAPYADEIDSWLASREETAGKGTVRFL